MNILICSDKNDVCRAGVPVTSFLENYKDVDFKAYIMTEGFNEENQQRMQQVFAQYHKEIEFVRLGNGEISKADSKVLVWLCRLFPSVCSEVYSR